LSWKAEVPEDFGIASVTVWVEDHRVGSQSGWENWVSSKDQSGGRETIQAEVNASNNGASRWFPLKTRALP
jgi:hypothetical protein